MEETSTTGTLGTKATDIRILVVDDDLYTRQVVMEGLRSRGYQVKDAEDGLQALHHLQRERFNLVVTDIQMPRMDGVALLREICRHDYAPVIVQTTLDTDRQPVVNLSWQDAAAYCNWLSGQEGLAPAYEAKGGRLVAVVPAEKRPARRGTALRARLVEAHRRYPRHPTGSRRRRRARPPALRTWRPTKDGSRRRLDCSGRVQLPTSRPRTSTGRPTSSSPWR